MHKRVAQLLAECGSQESVMPPTLLYNEGWLLRLVLDWFSRNRRVSHTLSLLPESRWYSEGLLPSRFLPKIRGDNRAESYTHADGIIGHFTVSPGERGEVKLSPNAKQFIVTEAKLGSALSVGTKNASDYDQAARNVACMAHMIAITPIDVTVIERIGFYVIAPERQIKAGIFGDLVTRESISQKVANRIKQYQGEWDEWYTSNFMPMLQRIDLSVMSWESILEVFPEDEEGDEIRNFYLRCQQFNLGKTFREV